VPNRLPGRKAEAARNDEAILNAARSTFLRDSNASMATIAEAAGVGVGGLYRRYPSKEALLRRLCGDGLREFVTLAEAALQDPSDPFDALAWFLRSVLAADLHALTVRLGGTFRSTEELRAAAERAADLVGRLVDQAAHAGRLRVGFTSTDVALLLEQVTAIRVADPARTRQLRDRALDLLLIGLDVTSPPTAHIPGEPPTAAEIGERWRSSHPQPG
jgi:AcrR family transcriptional regulator